MTFFDAIKTVFRKYAEFEGRATRPEFWWFALFSALVSAALGSLNVYTTTGAVGGQGLYDLAGTTSTTYYGAALASVWGVFVLLPSLAVTVRRLRDAGHRWVEIFWILLPIAGIIILVIRLVDASVSATPVTTAAPATPVPAPVTPAAPSPATKSAATRKPASTRPAASKTPPKPPTA